MNMFRRQGVLNLLSELIYDTIPQGTYKLCLIVSKPGQSQGRRRRFEPWSHRQWGIVEVSSPLPNLSAKQSELTVRTKNRPQKKKTHPLRKKAFETVYLAIICPKSDLKKKVPHIFTLELNYPNNGNNYSKMPKN